MYQYNKVILCKSLKITQYKKFNDVQQTKVAKTLRILVNKKHYIL